MTEPKDATVTARISADELDQLKAKAEAEDVSVGVLVRRGIKAVLAGTAVLAAAFALTACGSENASESPRDAVQQSPVAKVQDVAPEPVASESAAVEVDPIGSVQALRVDGASAGRVNVMSYDPSDSTATVDITTVEPVVIDPADFVITLADGSTIAGVAAVAAWDHDLAANDQTVGPIAFAGAVDPVSITYAPAGADFPLVWSFS